MIIVSGHLRVHPDDIDGFVVECRQVMESARSADGCLDFHMSVDLLEPGRINILERWLTREQLDAFRGEGTPADQATRIVGAAVSEFHCDREDVL